MADLDFKRWFAAKRAKALAIVLLTRRDDLKVQEPESETGKELSISFRSDPAEGERSFRILIQSGMSPVSVEQANAELQPTMAGFERMASFVPVCVFYFTASDDKGYYTWGLEPVVADGQPKLQNHVRADCRPLDNESRDEVVAQVVAWYEALAESLKV